MIDGFALGPTAVAVVAFCLLAVWCFSHRRVDRSLAVLALYLGLLDGYVKLRTGSPFVTLGRDVLVAAIAGGALLRSLSSGNPLPIPPLGAFVLAFSALVVVQVFNPLGDRSALAGLGGLRQHLEFVPLFFLGYAFIRRQSQLEKLLLILVVCAAAGGVVSYVQSTLSPEQLASWGPGYSERVLGTGAFTGAPRVAYGEEGTRTVRPFGLGSDLGGGAVAAALALPALIALMMMMGSRFRLATLPLALGIALALATSGTRAAIVMAAVTALAFALLAATSRNAVRVSVGLAVGLVFVYAAFEVLGPDNTTARRSETITPTRVLTTFTEERGRSVLKFADYAIDYPLGVGVGSSGAAAHRFRDPILSDEAFDSETQWNFLLIEVGVAGIVIFLAFNIRLMWLALTRIRRIPRPSLRLQLAALAAPLFGLIAAGFAGPTTISVPPAPYFWAVAGVLSYWLVKRHEPYDADEGRPSAMTGSHDARARRQPADRDRQLEPAAR